MNNVIRKINGNFVILVLLMLMQCGCGRAEQNRGDQVKFSVELVNPILEANIKQNTYIRIGLTGFEIKNKKMRTPVNVAIVLDKSGSMSGEKIDKAKQSAIEAIRRLNKNDIVSVVAYSDIVEVVVPATKVSDINSIIRKINSVKADGQTALFAGVSKGVAEIRKFISRKRINRVVLLSDGMANSGPSSPSALGALGASLSKENISVSTFGLGNHYNEDLMTQLASKSDGNHVFIESADSLGEIFAFEFGDGLEVVAQEVLVKIHCTSGVRPVRLLGMEGDINGNYVTVPVHQLYSLQERQVILEVEVAEGEADTVKVIADVSVSYDNLQTQKAAKLLSQISTQFSRLKSRVKEKTNKDAMVAVVEQIATQHNEMAVVLRDQGKIKEAQKILQTNADYLEENAKLYKSEKLKIQHFENITDMRNIKSDHDYQRQRKLMRDRQDDRTRRPRQ